MMLQFVATLTIIILTTLEAPMIIILTTLENIYITSVTYNGQNSFIVKAAGTCPIKLFAAVIFVVL
jgi:hypothetical protein